MAIERWGSLSVADHKDIAALTCNVLLYDRLVMPMYTEGIIREDGSTELEYWKKKKWNPELQQQRREQLGELAIESAWDQNRRESYSKRYKAAAQMNSEISGENVTRWLLSEDQEKYELPEGVNHTDVFVAYHSRQTAQDEIYFEEADPVNLPEESQIGLLLAHELQVPRIDEPEVALREAIDLGKDAGFRKKREELYNFQMTCLQRGMKPKAIVSELKTLNRELSDYVEKQEIPMIKKTGFMLAQVSLSILGGAFIHPLAAVGGLLSVWQFASSLGQPDDHVPSRLAPVAGFFDMEDKLGLNL